MISHLLFADDVLLFTKATRGQARVVRMTLNAFCRAPGMKVNENKSKVFAAPIVSRRTREQIRFTCNFPFTSDLGRYL
jgi:hypothetical protein